MTLLSIEFQNTSVIACQARVSKGQLGAAMHLCLAVIRNQALRYRLEAKREQNQSRFLEATTTHLGQIVLMILFCFVEPCYRFRLAGHFGC
jgi:hypothetical protein